MQQLLLVHVLTAVALAAQPPVAKPYFGIHVVDEQTGRGVPLIELRMVNGAARVTDSAGWVAVREPDLTGKEVYFHVSGPGYEFPQDGFGFRGRRLTITPGESATLKVRRTNLAERVCRLTGQGIYRDSELLGIAPPIKLPQRNVEVMGSDSVQAAPYRGKIFWLWGDTNLARYPLGNFHVTAATSPLPGRATFRPEHGAPLTFFMDDKDPARVRQMMPLDEPGAVWLFGLINIPDADGRETLLAHYSRQKQLGKVLEQGLARFDDEAGVFRKLKKLDLNEHWRHPRANAFTVEEDGKKYVYFSEPLAHVRVAARWASATDPAQYEALRFDQDAGEYRWQRREPPTTQDDERKLIAAGKMPPEQARYNIVDADSGRPVRIHRSSIAWNDFRKCWIMIGTQMGDRDASSFLGEIWYAEAPHPTGPWGRAVKIASHPQYSFYNPRQHTFFDEDGGQVIYFEGTYTRTFSGNPTATPRYDYNQILYRLDLSRLKVKR